MKQIMNHVRRYRALLAGIVILTILQVGSSLLSPTILATLVSNGILKQNQAVILQQGGFMLLTSTLDLVLSILVVRFIGIIKRFTIKYVYKNSTFLNSRFPKIWNIFLY